MTEAVSLKRSHSPTVQSDEPEEKYGGHSQPQVLLHPGHLAGMNPARGAAAAAVTAAPFPLVQYYHILQQQMQKAEFKDGQEKAVGPVPILPLPGIPPRRQTISTPSVHPSLRVNPFAPFLQIPPPDAPSSSAPVAIRPSSPPLSYNGPSFQRADEEIYTKFVESVRRLAVKLTAEKR